MPLDISSQELKNTLTELSFRTESAAVVLDRAALELPTALNKDVVEVIEMLRGQAATLRSLAERVQDGGIAVLQ